MSDLKTMRRNEILDAAAKVFMECGFEKARIEDIAHTAGIGKGTVYEYFDSKSMIFQQMIQRIMETMNEKAKQILQSDCSFRDKLLAYIDMHVKKFSEHQQIIFLFKKFMIRQDNISDMVGRQCRLFDELFLELVKSAVERGEIRQGIDPQLVLYLVQGPVLYLCNESLQKKSQFELHKTTVPLVDLILRGLQ